MLLCLVSAGHPFSIITIIHSPSLLSSILHCCHHPFSIVTIVHSPSLPSSILLHHHHPFSVIAIVHSLSLPLSILCHCHHPFFIIAFIHSPSSPSLPTNINSAHQVVTDQNDCIFFSDEFSKCFLRPMILLSVCDLRCVPQVSVLWFLLTLVNNNFHHCIVTDGLLSSHLCDGV